MNHSTEGENPMDPRKFDFLSIPQHPDATPNREDEIEAAVQRRERLEKAAADIPPGVLLAPLADLLDLASERVSCTAYGRAIGRDKSTISRRIARDISTMGVLLAVETANEDIDAGELEFCIDTKTGKQADIDIAVLCIVVGQELAATPTHADLRRFALGNLKAFQKRNGYFIGQRDDPGETWIIALGRLPDSADGAVTNLSPVPVDSQTMGEVIPTNMAA